MRCHRRAKASAPDARRERNPDRQSRLSSRRVSPPSSLVSRPASRLVPRPFPVSGSPFAPARRRCAPPLAGASRVVRPRLDVREFTPIAPFQQLEIYGASLDLAARVHGAQIADGELRDQARRASKSVFLNLCEGLPSYSALMRRKYFNTAYGSLCEVAGALDLASAIGVIEPAEANAIHAIGCRVARLLRGLRR
jgi:four helix bundle protein